MNNLLLSVLFGSLMLAFNTPATAFNGPSADSRPNIILISIETTRADHLGCYGYKRNTSPTIDRLAQEGIRFENMFGARGLTWPALTSVMTSLYPVNHGVRENGHQVFPHITHLAEILKVNGYNCAAFLGNADSAVWKGFDTKVRARRHYLTRSSTKWLHEHHRDRIFLWVHFFEPHKPYMPPPSYDKMFTDPNYNGRVNGSSRQMASITARGINLRPADLNHLIALYDGSIRYVDYQITRILSELKGLDIYDDSLIIVTADHGEDLYQHNKYFFHAGSIHDSSLHIPFIMKLPNGDKGPMSIPDIVESIDIAPTILELASLTAPDAFEGQSLMPLIRGQNNPGAFQAAYSEWRNMILSIRTDRYRYIYNPNNHHPKVLSRFPDWGYFVAEEELYDIQKDPGESDNIVLREPEVANELKNRLFEWSNYKRWKGNDSIEKQDKFIPPEIIERLRSLGYL